MIPPLRSAKPPTLGVLAGAVFAIVEFSARPGIISDDLRVLVYCAILVLLSAPFLQSTRQGVICGILALLTQTTLDILYYGSNNALGITATTSVFLNSLPAGIGSPSFDYRFTYLLAGALASYVGRRIQGTPHKPTFTSP